MSAKRARTLDEALDVLDVVPLDFSGKPSSPASDPAFYTELPPPDHEDLPGAGLAERLRMSLLGRMGPARLFLSGHVGSGKSTQINRLAEDEKINEAFTVIVLRVEPHLAPFLDGAQILFLMAGALFDRGKQLGLLKEGARWEKSLRALDARLNGDSGIIPREGKTIAEFSLLFAKVSQELQFSVHRRRQFRELGETQETLFIDILNAITLDITASLSERGSARSPLLLIDDLDKVRGPEQQTDIYETNLGALLRVPFSVLYTVPTGVALGSNRPELRRTIEHLYPLRVLDKAPLSFDAERAFIPGSDAYFRDVL
ncbi:MAG TPA: hypothetical protein VLS89_20260, partial [Candidatus Nanopelagicales bacterium]|nr:hypothetical protein [Candidatus Nanopelagicales bacterium]